MNKQAPEPKSRGSHIDGRRFGRHVRLLRLARGLTQEGLAQHAQLSADSIRRLEHGSFSPSLETLAKLTSGMDLQLSTVFASFELGERDVGREIADAISGLSDRQLETLLKIIREIRDFVTGEDELAPRRD